MFHLRFYCSVNFFHFRHKHQYSLWSALKVKRAMFKVGNRPNWSQTKNCFCWCLMWSQVHTDICKNVNNVINSSANHVMKNNILISECFYSLTVARILYSMSTNTHTHVYWLPVITRVVNHEAKKGFGSRSKSSTVCHPLHLSLETQHHHPQILPFPLSHTHQQMQRVDL